LQKLMITSTWLNKWRMQGNFTKSKVMVFHPGGRIQRAGAGPPEHLDTRSPHQVSTYKYPGVVYQEDGSWQYAQRRSQRCKQPRGTGGHLPRAAVCRQRSDCSWFDSSTRGHVWRGGTRRRRSKTRDVSGRKESSQHSSPASPRLLF
jgi:hypothetical protein